MKKTNTAVLWTILILDVIAFVAVIIFMHVIMSSVPEYEADFSEDTGEVLNIYVHSELFVDVMEEYYPDYERISDTEGEINDVKVNWVFVDKYNYSYEDELEDALRHENGDDAVDIYFVEPRYDAEKFVESPYCLSMEELGLDVYMNNQYPYITEAATDEDGNVNAVAYEVTPGIFVYNKEIAEEVFGSSDPDTVQEYVSDWENFEHAAEMLEEEGYYILSTCDETYRIFAQSAPGNWVTDEEIMVDTTLMDWVEMTEKYVDEGYFPECQLWSFEWCELTMAEEPEFFGMFGTAWFVEQSLPYTFADGDDWAACAGPAGYFWGGELLLVSSESDNVGLARDIIYQLTCNPEIMREMAEDGIVVNSTEVMSEIAEEGKMTSDFLDDQEVGSIYNYNASRAVFNNASEYDSQLDMLFQDEMIQYCIGESSKRNALDAFYENAETQYPELSH